MGAYLSEPLTTKDSHDEGNDLLVSGSSSMQGWRISQEDAHNCILNFDENLSFFAVYDGHGGSEVAQYCSLHLPAFLKTLKSYKSKNFEQALKDAFIGFDATLLEETVIEELKKLSDKTNGEEAVEEDDEEDEEDDNVDDLCKEACMPLNEVLQMYKKDQKNPVLSKIKEGNCSKPLSPYLKSKRKGLSCITDDSNPSSTNTSAVAGSSSTEPDGSNEIKTSIPDAIDSTVSSSSNKAGENRQNPEPSSTKAEQIDEISDTDGIASAVMVPKEDCAPDSSSSSKSTEEAESNSKDVKSIPTVNGEVVVASKSTVSSSSTSSNQENGIVSSNTNSGEAGTSCTSKSSGTKVDTSSPGSSSSPAASKKRQANNGPNIVDDDSEDDDTDTDEEFPPVADANETSSTEDGEEDHYCDEGSEEEEDEEEEGDYEEDEEEYMNEEDEAFMNNITDEPGKDSGCTAVVALLHEKELLVANAGDSRCVVCRDGKALEMSFDHKPEDQIEFERIQKAGGRVTLDGRVNGGLNLSRAIGDHGYKMNKNLPPEEQMISALPDIKRITIGPEDEFMVLACDGIWNFMTSDDVVEFVQERIRDPTKKLSDICEEMFDYCLAPHTKGDGTGCDNMTAIIVQFKPNFSGAASRKRTASAGSDTPKTESDRKKVRTDTGASSTTGSNGDKHQTISTATTTSDEKEAAAAVASIEPSSPMDSSDNTASSST